MLLLYWTYPLLRCCTVVAFFNQITQITTKPQADPRQLTATDFNEPYNFTK